MLLSRLAKPLGFFIIAALPTGSNLLLTLVLVRGLGIEGFALWSIIEPMLLIFGTVTGLGMHQGLLFVTARTADDPARALGAAITAALPLSLAFATLVWLVARQAIESIGYVSLIVPLVAEALALLIISSLRGQRKMSAWIAFEMIRSLGLVIVAFLAFHLDSAWVRQVDKFLLLRGVFTGSAVVVIALWLGARPCWDRQVVQRMIRYGAPIAGAGLIALVTASSDRFLLAALHGDAQVIASYAAHQRLTGILGVMTVTPLNLWFAVEAMRRDTAANASFFQGVLTAVLLALSSLMLVAFIGGPLVWPWLFPTIAFNPIIFGVLALAVVPQSVAIVLNIGGLREKKTHLNALVVACSSATMIVLGLPLVYYGAAVGAAVARLSSYVANAAASRAVSQRIAPVDHRIVPLLPVAAALATAVASLFHRELSLPFWVLPVATAALVACTLAFEAGRIQAFLGTPKGRDMKKIADSA